MTDERRHLEILAKLGGYKKISVVYTNHFRGTKDGKSWETVCRYDVCLNAAQRLIDALPNGYLESYDAQLWLITSARMASNHNATAAEKCEALLKAAKRW